MRVIENFEHLRLAIAAALTESNVHSEHALTACRIHAIILNCVSDHHPPRMHRTEHLLELLALTPTFIVM